MSLLHERKIRNGSERRDSVRINSISKEVPSPSETKLCLYHSQTFNVSLIVEVHYIRNCLSQSRHVPRPTVTDRDQKKLVTPVCSLGLPCFRFAFDGHFCTFFDSFGEKKHNGRRI